MAFFEVACKLVDTDCCRIPINYFDCHWLTFDHVAWWVVFQFSVGLLVVRTSAWEATIRFTDRYVFVILFFRCRLFNNNAKGLQKLVKIVPLVVNQSLRHRREFKRPNAKKRLLLIG